VEFDKVFDKGWKRRFWDKLSLCAGLINTPLQRGVGAAEAVETVSTVYRRATATR